MENDFIAAAHTASSNEILATHNSSRHGLTQTGPLPDFNAMALTACLKLNPLALLWFSCINSPVHLYMYSSLPPCCLLPSKNGLMRLSSPQF